MRYKNVRNAASLVKLLEKLQTHEARTPEEKSALWKAQNTKTGNKKPAVKRQKTIVMPFGTTGLAVYGQRPIATTVGANTEDATTLISRLEALTKAYYYETILDGKALAGENLQALTSVPLKKLAKVTLMVVPPGTTPVEIKGRVFDNSYSYLKRNALSNIVGKPTADKGDKDSSFDTVIAAINGDIKPENGESVSYTAQGILGLVSAVAA